MLVIDILSVLSGHLGATWEPRLTGGASEERTLGRGGLSCDVPALDRSESSSVVSLCSVIVRDPCAGLSGQMCGIETGPSAGARLGWRMATLQLLNKFNSRRKEPLQDEMSSSRM